ncbi:MAG: HmuY family protein [Candidatus Limimorpha sp.]
MYVRQKISCLISGVIAMLSLSACNGIFENLYDKPLPEEDNEYGFIIIDDVTRTGRIYIDATDYKEWHYIDLLNKVVTTSAVDAYAPTNWNFAVHRYDAKTNGGAVYESDANDFGTLPDIESIPQESFVADEWTTEQITVDMSQMMDGIILYAEDYYNPNLSKWLDVDTSTMPPIYTMSGKVYILRLADGSYAALRLANFMNDAAVKGFMTIDYFYPIKL